MGQRYRISAIDRYNGTVYRIVAHLSDKSQAYDYICRSVWHRYHIGAHRLRLFALEQLS